ncbi:MAG: transcription antitermination factor NusB [Thermodesulfobacteriota bacterium]
MGLRRKSRELALQCLYQMDQGGDTEGGGIEIIKSHFEVSARSVPYAEELVACIKEHREELDEVLNRHSRHWRIFRMAVIDRNLLRIAVCEILYRDEVPGSVAINEAVEIAKRYGSDDSASFINGILDAILEEVSNKV